MKEISEYIESLELGGKSPLTIKAYKKDIEKMVSYFGVSEISELNNFSVSEFLDFYKSTGLKEKSLNSLIRNLYPFMKAMVAEKKISEDNAFFNVRFGGRKFVKETKKIKPVLTQEESEKIILSARNSQERFMVAMALKTALRRSEIANIKMSDIDGCKIRITSKGGDEYYTHLNTTLCDMLNEYIQDRDTDSEYLFYGIKGVQSADGRITGTSVNNRVRACAKRAGIEKNITAHRLRATAITNAAVNHGMALAQGLARHKSISTTNIYVNTEEAVKNLLLED